MDITEGFKLDEPNVFVPWEIDENGISTLLEEHKIHKVTEHYYTLESKCFDGLECTIGFYFNKEGNKINKIGFFRQNYKGSLEDSFKDFQFYLEKSFGPPQGINNDEKFPRYSWQFNKDILIFHYVYDRFGPEENVYITRLV